MLELHTPQDALQLLHRGQRQKADVHAARSRDVILAVVCFPVRRPVSRSPAQQPHKALAKRQRTPCMQLVSCHCRSVNRSTWPVLAIRLCMMEACRQAPAASSAARPAASHAYSGAAPAPSSTQTRACFSVLWSMHQAAVRPQDSYARWPANRPSSAVQACLS